MDSISCSLAEIQLWRKKKEKKGKKLNKIEHGMRKGEGRESSSSARERAGGWPGGLAERPAGATLFLSH